MANHEPYIDDSRIADSVASYDNEDSTEAPCRLHTASLGSDSDSTSAHAQTVMDPTLTLTSSQAIEPLASSSEYSLGKPTRSITRARLIND